MQMNLRKNENGHKRGIHILVLNPESGHVSGQIFDTYKTSIKFELFIKKDIKPGQIIVAAC